MLISVEGCATIQRGVPVSIPYFFRTFSLNLSRFIYSREDSQIDCTKYIYIDFFFVLLLPLAFHQLLDSSGLLRSPNDHMMIHLILHS